MADMMERYIHESSRAFYPAQGITSGQELIGMGTSYQGFSANGTYVSPVWSKIYLLFLSKKLQKIIKALKALEAWASQWIIN